MITEQTAKVIRYDGKIPRTVLEGFALIPGKPNPMYGYVEDENGFPIYEVTQRYAGLLVTARADRYRLYQTKPFRFKTVNRANGAATYPMQYSWRYIKSMVADGEDPENKEKKFKDVYKWEQGDERNTFSGPVEPEKFVHSNVPDLEKVAAKEPRTPPNQWEVMGGLRQKLADLLPGGHDDVKVHVLTINEGVEKYGGGAYKAKVFPTVVKEMEALIEKYSQSKDDVEQTEFENTEETTKTETGE